MKGDLNATSTFEVDFLYRLLSGMGAGKIAANDCIRLWSVSFVPYVPSPVKTSTIERQEVTLDIIKNPAHYRKSRFLHQMEFWRQVSPPFSLVRLCEPEEQNLVREQWICRYGTGVETRLIDLSVYGVTLSQVCNSLIEKILKTA